jgi:Tol biopolymer transport system component
MDRKKGILLLIPLFLGVACAQEEAALPRTIPRQDRWGIYSMDLNGQELTLIYSSPTTISNIRMNPEGKMLVFAKEMVKDSAKSSEIFTIHVDGEGETRLTNNDYMDTYPVWSPDGEQIAYLSWPSATLDIYLMDKDGKNHRLLYDSGFHDADIDWKDRKVVFTRNSRIWIMESDGTNANALTNPPRAGEQGKANLPFGDYDPRINPNGNTIIFERLENDDSIHGNYNLYMINIDGTDLKQITSTGYTQGLPSWSPTGKEILFIVTAIHDEGKYDIYKMDAEGGDARNITPGNFPPNFLIHEAVFPREDTQIFFIAEWWG